MTRIGLSCLCIGALLPPVSLHADPTPTASPTLEEFKADFEKQDAELNQVYTETMARLPPEQQKELKKSEVEWIKHRDQEGTDPGLNWLILSFKTRERIKDIRADFPLENGPYPPPGYSEARDEGAESPRGDFVIKVFRGEGADIRRQEAWIVSKDDPSQRQRLRGSTDPSSTEHFISPDARWMVRWRTRRCYPAIGRVVMECFRRERADIRRQEAWIVSTDDPSQRQRLRGSTDASSTEHFISPDARWIVRWRTRRCYPAIVGVVRDHLSKQSTPPACEYR